MADYKIPVIGAISELKELLGSVKKVRLYGAGYYLNVFLQELEHLDKSYLEKIACIIVRDTKGNSPEVKNIPIVAFRDAGLKAGEYVLLTLGNRFVDEVYGLLKDTGACIVRLNFDMFQEIPYRDVEKSIRPFLEAFPEKLTGLNEPVFGSHAKLAWTCWWQGEEQAPGLVKACWKSQRKHLPPGVRHIIITKDNYKDYIALPAYIMEKVEKGTISLATLSDIIRAALLYKYGGFWMDSTLFVVKPLDRDILDFPVYTRNLPETQYCTNVMWADWFFYAKPGNKLFRFLMEGFFYYFTVHDKIQYYFTVDYIIAIACNRFPDIEGQLRGIPYNNEKAMELGKHLAEPFEETIFKKYIQGTSIQKLTYKVNCKKQENTIYQYILDCE